ncbi:hypothetical protein SUNI508_10882 [Seiridium unicorne]|uniref:Uncharacterized protein n=1 Tax=Seiridium unicorne TaxID=138068 RepID=A0ABR2UK67_9PEZI
MPVSPSSRIPATSLPNITSLREDLDYGNSHLTRCNVFYDDVRGFRKKFHTSTGLPGPDLHNWKLKEHQAGLDEMTAAYLDRDGNGPLYWPDSSSSANFNKLQYSKDRTRIKRLMKQLFFRLNQQQYRNKRYKNKDKIKSPEPEPQPRGLSSDDPIDVDALPLSLGDGPGINLDKPQRPSKNTPAANVVKAASSSKRGAKVKVENPDSGDIYEFQETPEPEQSVFFGSWETKSPAHYDVQSRNSIRHDKQTPKRKQNPLTPDHAAKRSRPPNGSPGKNTDPPLNPSQSPKTPARRSSDRPRKTVCKEDYVPSGDLDEFLQRLNSEETPATSSDAPRRPEVLLKDDSLWIHGENRREELVTKASNSNNEGTASESPYTADKPNADEQRASSPKYPPRGESSAGVSALKSHTEKQFMQAKLDHITPGQRPSNFPLEFNQTNAKANTDARPQGKAPMAAMETTEGLRQESEKPDAPRPRALPKPVIEFIYRIILSRTPIYSYRSWNPTRKLEETSLAQIIEELGLAADAKGIIFTAEGPNFRAVEEVLRDDEIRFSSFIKQIKRAIRGLLMSGRGVNSPIVFDMEIEPMRGDSTKGDEEFDDDFTI